MANAAVASQTTSPVPTAPSAEADRTDVGVTRIEDAVVAKIAGIAAREVSGVHALGGGAARVVGAIRDAINTTDHAQGIRVEVGETQVAVDATIVADYPVSLQRVAADVRAAIHLAMVDLVGLDVAEINVTIDDVHIPSDDAPVDDEEDTVEVRVL